MKSGTFVRSPRQLQRLADRVGRPVRSMGAYIENGGERVYGRVADVGYGKTMAVLANGETAMVAEKALSAASTGTAAASVGLKVGAKLAPRVFAIAGLKTASHFIPYVGWGLAIIGGTKEAVKAAYRHSQYGWEPKALPRDLLKVTAGVIGIEDLFDWYPRAERTVAKTNPMRRPTGTLRAHVLSDATSLTLLLTDGGRPQGYLHLYSVNGQTAVPTAAAAEKGYGPLLYDLGATLSGWSIYPSKERSPSAKAFWSKQKGPFVPLKASEFERKYGRHPDDFVDEDFQHVPAAEYWSHKYLGQFRTNTGWRKPWQPRDADMKRIDIAGLGGAYVFRMPTNDPERVYSGFGFYRAREDGSPSRNHLFEFDVKDGKVVMSASTREWLRSVISFNEDIRNGDELMLSGLQRALKPVRSNPPRTAVTLYHPRLGLFVDVPGYDPIMLASPATVRSLYIENKLLRRKKFPPPPPLRFRDGKPTDYTLGVLEVYVRSILSDAGADIRPLERVNRRRNPAPVAYIGIILDDPNHLLDWWRKNVGPTLPKLDAHHMVDMYNPSYEYIESNPVGHGELLTVVGYAQNEHVQAVVVEGFWSDNAVPHVVVATDGSPPSLANDLLAGGWVPVRNGPDLYGRCGYRSKGKDVFTLGGV